MKFVQNIMHRIKYIKTYYSSFVWRWYTQHIIKISVQPFLFLLKTSWPNEFAKICWRWVRNLVFNLRWHVSSTPWYCMYLLLVEIRNKPIVRARVAFQVGCTRPANSFRKSIILIGLEAKIHNKSVKNQTIFIRGLSPSWYEDCCMFSLERKATRHKWSCNYLGSSSAEFIVLVSISFHDLDVKNKHIPSFKFNTQTWNERAYSLFAPGLNWVEQYLVKQWWEGVSPKGLTVLIQLSAFHLIFLWSALFSLSPTQQNHFFWQNNSPSRLFPFIFNLERHPMKKIK